MHFYSSEYKNCLELPLRTFWMMSNNINRLNAEKDIRQMSVAASVGSEKGFQQSSEALRAEMGEVFVKPEINVAKEGIKRLKEIAGKMRAK